MYVNGSSKTKCRLVHILIIDLHHMCYVSICVVSHVCLSILHDDSFNSTPALQMLVCFLSSSSCLPVAPTQRKIPGSNPAGGGIFSGPSHTSDSKIGIPVATLPGAWCYRVSAGTGQPGVSIL